jgi:hypothetical protein
MKREEIIAKVNEIIKEKRIENLRADSIMNVNRKPHTPVIGPATLKYASEHEWGVIGDNSNAPCCQKGCKLALKDHTKGDVVLFLKLSGMVTKTDVDKLFAEIGGMLEAEKIVHLSFVTEHPSYKIVEG